MHRRRREAARLARRGRAPGPGGAARDARPAAPRRGPRRLADLARAPGSQPRTSWPSTGRMRWRWPGRWPGSWRARRARQEPFPERLRRSARQEARHPPLPQEARGRGPAAQCQRGGSTSSRTRKETALPLGLSPRGWCYAPRKVADEEPLKAAHTSLAVPVAGVEPRVEARAGAPSRREPRGPADAAPRGLGRPHVDGQLGDRGERRRWRQF